MRICDVKKCGKQAGGQGRFDFPDFELCQEHYDLSCDWFNSLVSGEVKTEVIGEESK